MFSVGGEVGVEGGVRSRRLSVGSPSSAIRRTIGRHRYRIVPHSAGDAAQRVGRACPHGPDVLVWGPGDPCGCAGRVTSRVHAALALALGCWEQSGNGRGAGVGIELMGMNLWERAAGRVGVPTCRVLMSRRLGPLQALAWAANGAGRRVQHCVPVVLRATPCGAAARSCVRCRCQASPCAAGASMLSSSGGAAGHSGACTEVLFVRLANSCCAGRGPAAPASVGIVWPSPRPSVQSHALLR